MHFSLPRLPARFVGNSLSPCTASQSFKSCPTSCFTNTAQESCEFAPTWRSTFDWAHAHRSHERYCGCPGSKIFVMQYQHYKYYVIATSSYFHTYLHLSAVCPSCSYITSHHSHESVFTLYCITFNEIFMIFVTCATTDWTYSATTCAQVIKQKVDKHKRAL